MENVQANMGDGNRYFDSNYGYSYLVIRGYLYMVIP